jgi:colanic acid/amylovoran biosynthesis protein
MTIGIMGTPVSSGNRGVLALGASLVNLCAGGASSQEVVLLLGNRDNRAATFRINGVPRAVRVVNHRLSPRARWRDHFAVIVLMAVLYRMLPFSSLRRRIAARVPWIDAVERADFVGDIRGGDSFSDIYGLQRFLSGFLSSWTVILVKGSIVHFPQTYGPYRSPVARRLARYLLNKSSIIIARDLASQRVARELVGPDQEVLLSPDVAFSLEAIVPERIELDPPMQQSEFQLSAFSFQHLPRPIGLNVNGLMYNGGYTRSNMFGLKLDYAAFLPELVTALLKAHCGELWLVPHTFAPDGSVESDPEASRKLRDALPQELRSRVRIVARAYDQYEIKGVVGLCDFFIGSRMHACIAALSQGIPCVGVAYSMKFSGVFDSVGMGEWVVDGRTMDNAAAVEQILRLYDRRDEVRQQLGRNADQARERLVEVFRTIIPGRE